MAPRKPTSWTVWNALACATTLVACGGGDETPDAEAAPAPASAAISPGCIAVRAPVSGSIWQLNVAAGQSVAAGEELLVIEAIKMEVNVKAGLSGIGEGIYCEPGRPASAGDALLSLRPPGVASA